jgi:hypothetical protein
MSRNILLNYFDEVERILLDCPNFMLSYLMASFSVQNALIFDCACVLI